MVAVMLILTGYSQGVEVITSHSIHNSLHSVGGIQMLLPLFAQIDMPHEGREPPVDYAIW